MNVYERTGLYHSFSLLTFFFAINNSLPVCQGSVKGVKIFIIITHKIFLQVYNLAISILSGVTKEKKEQVEKNCLQGFSFQVILFPLCFSSK